MRCKALLLALFVVAASPGLWATGDERDIVYLTNGKQRSGRVLLETEDSIILLVKTREVVIKRAKIKRIESVARSQAELLQLFGQVPDQAEGLWQLVEYCQENKLPHEAKLFCWRILSLSPDHAAAHAALGHKKNAKGWRLQVGRAWKTLVQAEELRGEWNQAWELRSEHFQMRSNAGLARTVRTLLELEQFYRSFYDIFQEVLELRELTEPIKIHFHKDRQEFPSQGNHTAAYFTPSANTLYTYMEPRGRPQALFHEATHALLYNLGGRARAGKGQVPPWLDEAWAEFMDACMVPGKGGRARLDLGRRNGMHLRVLREEKKTYDLHRVLNFNASDYQASTRQSLKYAQSYALFLYLMVGEESRYLPAFMEYLQLAMGGKGQASSFRRLFAKDLTKIEKAYLQLR